MVKPTDLNNSKCLRLALKIERGRIYDTLNMKLKKKFYRSSQYIIRQDGDTHPRFTKI